MSLFKVTTQVTPNKYATKIKTLLWLCELDFKTYYNNSSDQPDRVPIDPLNSNYGVATGKNYGIAHTYWRTESRYAQIQIGPLYPLFH